MIDNIRIKKGKSLNTLGIIRFSLVLMVFLIALITVYVFTGGRAGLKFFLVLFLCSIPLSLICAFVVEKAGSGLGSLLSGWFSKSGVLRESLAADLNRAGHCKREGEFQDALNIVDGVLDKDWRFPDALYLKAQILVEGFGKLSTAKTCLKKAHKLVSHDEALYCWIDSYYEKIVDMEKRDWLT